MAINRGKQFENVFVKCWEKSFPTSFLLRLPDQMSGYKVSAKNLCDFIGFNDGILYLLEIKTHKGASLPLNNITQYQKMRKYINVNKVRVGVILWLVEKDIILYIPISTIEKLYNDNKKSVGLKALNDGYNIKIIPSVKKRVFMDSDYSILMDLQEGE